MHILKVPYAQKDQAKALGARWNNERKVWYVPDGQPTAPFERWLTTAAPGADAASAAKPAKARVDAHAGAPVTGALYVELKHECNPFIKCLECGPVLERSGWTAAHRASRAMLRAI